MTDDESFQEIADDVALARTEDLEPVSAPFEPLIEELGLSKADGAAEQVLVYRESPDRECFVCGEPLPQDTRNLAEGDEYLIQRVNEVDSPYPLIERTFHVDCWERRREQG